MILNRLFNLCLFTTCLNQVQQNDSQAVVRTRRFPAMPQFLDIRTPMLNIRDNIRRGRMRMIQQMHGKKEVCYGTVGCFEVRRHSPLMKTPDSPLILNTKFYLFRRDINFSTPTALKYDDVPSLTESTFKPSVPTKFIIHGYMSSWNEKGALAAAQGYLQIGDYNVILVDWENGAKGPQYRTAVANTEVVGRQLGLLLINMIKAGLSTENIHLCGFSLGAHVAGASSEILKSRGYLIGRITAMDPASPLFKHHLLRDQSKKLDKSDAKFVDVIHTDGSPIFTDGFGLLEPIGHVDYFPNGGREQPGCTDGRGSVVVAQLEPLNRDIACSHIRAWRYFLESILIKAADPNNGCKFIAYPCPKGLVDFTYGKCFPSNLFDTTDPLRLDDRYRNDFGYLGEDAKGTGIMYLVTKNSEPFCGMQLQVSVHVSQRTLPTRGILQLQLEHGPHKTNFQVKCELLDIIPVGHVMQGLAAADFGSMQKNITRMRANISYQSLAFQSPKNITISPKLFIDKIQVNDMFGNSWSFCAYETEVVDKRGGLFETLGVELQTRRC